MRFSVFLVVFWPLPCGGIVHGGIKVDGKVVVFPQPTPTTQGWRCMIP